MLQKPLRKNPVTLWLSVGTAVLYALDPPVTRLSYIIFAPWLHQNAGHLVVNISGLLVAGTWTERRVGPIAFAKFAILTAYFSLNLSVALGFEGFAIGMSGLTKGLFGYVGIVLVGKVNREFRTLNVDIRNIIEFGFLGAAALLIGIYILVIIGQFLDVIPHGENSAVGAHMIGLLFGWLWYLYRHS